MLFSQFSRGGRCSQHDREKIEQEKGPDTLRDATLEKLWGVGEGSCINFFFGGGGGFKFSMHKFSFSMKSLARIFFSWAKVWKVTE